MAMIHTTTSLLNTDRPDDPPDAKVLIMAVITQMVAEGGARVILTESGAHQLHCATGEIFLLGGKTITRLA